MTATALDTSPAAVSARRVALLLAEQDRVAALVEGGTAPRDVARDLGVPTTTVHRTVSVATHRRRAREAAAAEVDLFALALTDADLLLLRALATEQRALWEDCATRSPEGKNVSWRARRARGWACAHARKRIATEVTASGDRTADRYTGWAPGLGLVTLTGNGYMLPTALGWAAIGAAMPEILPW